MGIAAPRTAIPFFGIPSRQAYRELRLFTSLASRATKTSKPDAAVLMDPKLDAVLAAADVGCFATYIMKQVGVLVPRKNTSFIPPTSRQPNQEPMAITGFVFMAFGRQSPVRKTKYARTSRHVRW